MWSDEAWSILLQLLNLDVSKHPDSEPHFPGLVSPHSPSAGWCLSLIPSHLQAENVTTAIAAIAFLGKKHLGSIPWISDCSPVQLSSWRTGTELEWKMGEEQSHECWVIRICRAVSCTAGPDPCPCLVIYLNRANCMFHTLRTMDSWRLTSTWETCFGSVLVEPLFLSAGEDVWITWLENKGIGGKKELLFLPLFVLETKQNKENWTFDNLQISFYKTNNKNEAFYLCEDDYQESPTMLSSYVLVGNQHSYCEALPIEAMKLKLFLKPSLEDQKLLRVQVHNMIPTGKRDSFTDAEWFLWQ